MNAFSSVEDLLDFAIGEEEKAAAFYTALAQKQTNVAMKRVFEGFAEEEVGHKAKLIGIKNKKFWSVPDDAPLMNLQIADYTVDIEPSANMDLQDALLLAMKKEKAAFRLYSDLAASVDDIDLKESLLMLANEEAKHKVRFEVEYDDTILSEN